MTLTSQDARLLLILTGHSHESAIRPSDFTAQHTLALIERLKAASHWSGRLSQTMLDKIAAEIEAAVAEEDGDDSVGAAKSFSWHRVARAALTAMMEGPYPLSMAWDMNEASDRNDADYFGRDYHAAFVAGIQAILNEGAEK